MSDVYNRVLRRTNKQRLHSNKELKLLRELVNDYDISDWWWYDKDNPDVEFHSNQWRLRSLQINSSSGERIELLERNKLNN